MTLDENGKPRQKRKTVFGKTQREVKEKIEALRQHKRDYGAFPKDSKLRVGDFLNNWLDDQRSRVSASTHARYEGIVRNHLCNTAGNRLSQLTEAKVRQLLSNMEKDGASKSQRHQTYAVLNNAMNQAKAQGKIQIHPCDNIQKPKPDRRDIYPLTPEQSRFLFDITKESRFHAVFVVAVTSGMRQGEIFGLLWRNVDLDKGVITVSRSLQEVSGRHTLKETKTRAGQRRVTLPRITVDVLREHRASSTRESWKRSKSEPEQQKYEWASDLVFTDSKGGPIRKSNFLRNVWHPARKQLCEEFNLTQFTFHDLRHTAASDLLLQGEHPKVVQERLGQSSIQMTMDTYSHLVQVMDERAASRIDDLYGDDVA